MLPSETLPAHLNALPAGMLLHTTGDLSTRITAPFVETAAAVQPGGVFIARRGRSVDGHQFIPAAVAGGAAAIIGEVDPAELPALSIPYVQVADAAQAIGWLAASYYGFPARRLVVIGVTGTDGKTTTTHLIHSIFKLATGGRTGFISTLAADFGSATADTGLHVTTPGAPEVQLYLARMVAAGLTHVVLEMTSHGLAQGRLNGVEVDIAVLTNLTHEHLDYHGTFENYRAAKGRLFEMLSSTPRKPGIPKRSIINRDDPNYSFYAAFPADEVISYGLHETAQVRATGIHYAPDGTQFEVDGQKLALLLVGEFNVYNALAALAVARSAGYADFAPAGLRAIPGVAGRMERLYAGQNFTAIVDFAHTPNALEKALTAGRRMLAPGQRLIAVFGSAGLRDVAKRRLMAEVSARLADLTILTAEDPRTESLDEILAMMARGCEAQGGIEGETFLRVPDRGAALYRACQLARPGDLVMACGKGHEQSMCFGVVEYPWDDRTALLAALRGAPLRTLPTAAAE